MGSDWNASPEDIELIRYALVDGLIDHEDLPTSIAANAAFESVVTERQAFELLARRIRWMRENLNESELQQWQEQKHAEKVEAIKRRARAPYIAALAIIVLGVLSAFLVCNGRDDKCVTAVQTRDGTECVEYESDTNPL